MNREVYNDLGGLQRGIMGLDTAEIRDVYVQGPDTQDNRMTQSKAHKAVWNTDQNALACIASNRYTLIQHRTAFQPVIDALKTVGLSSWGFVRDGHNQVAIEMILEGRGIVVDGDEIKLGMRFTNSYDKTRSFSGQLFGYRSACKNGMILGKALKVEMSFIHVGNVKAEKEILRFMKASINSSEQLKVLVSECMTDTYEWAVVEQALMALVKRKKWVARIQEELKELPRITRWDVYNAFTSIASHDEEISFGAADWLQSKAQSVLIGPLEVPHGNQ